ncbi:dihydrolipoyl dehydrogenase family protein [Pseudoroseicyclus aestuarii]|uniref:NADPH-glutathione reductase n=1 Tax=Pseudoroseicyclus aestuarii TaxID=1795041 RepID=A0A318T5Y8_9RHOB|nr:FAD-dependent oxidoreductase [Pseudoroseicyclus aestuarii]PYE83788.1 NADPH-glutathione reductase [Pseudoroseicyclus aestuarii]
MKSSYDIVVIGAGSAGVALSRTAAARGLSVLTVERAQVGGTCVNRGCVPKKLMWTVADAVSAARGLAGTGVLTQPPQVEMARLCALRAEKIESLRDIYERRLDGCGAELRRGEARVIEPGVVEVEGQRVEAAHIVLATGGHPVLPDIPGAELADVSHDVLQWTALPASILVVGGGYIGCELAAIHAALGAQVTVVTDTDRVLTEFSAPAAKTGQTNMEAQGIDVRTGLKPVRIEAATGGYRVTLTDGAVLTVEKVVMAVGRKPTLDLLGEMKEGATLGKNDALAVNDRFETSIPGLYAIGDCADRLPLTPVAVSDGECMGKQLAGEDAQPIDLAHVATSAFVIPPVAEVGFPPKRETIAEDSVSPLSAAVRDPAPQDYWAVAGAEGRVEAVSLVGDGAHEAIGWAAQCVLSRPPRDGMSRALAVHPSMSEEPMG